MTALINRTLPGTSPGAVDRAEKALGLNGIRGAKGVRATIPGKDGKRARYLLNRDFTAAAPNRTWVMDFTYCSTWAGFTYVSFIVDVFAQKIVAWHTETRKDVEFVKVPLRMATWQRQREGHPIVDGELIGHSDAGSQYTAVKYADRLELEGLRPSIGMVGDAFDNALMETVIGLFKTIADVEWATAEWVDWYNNRRLHGTLEMMTPQEFEDAHYAALNRRLQPA